MPWGWKRTFTTKVPKAFSDTSGSVGFGSAAGTVAGGITGVTGIFATTGWAIAAGKALGISAAAGAGAVVGPGKIIEGGYMWLGAPAKRIRPLTEKELAYFAYSAQHGHVLPKIGDSRRMFYLSGGLHRPPGERLPAKVFQ